MYTIVLPIIIVVFIFGISLGLYLTPEKIVEVEKPNLFTGNVVKEMAIVGVNEKGEGVKGTLIVEMKEGTGLVLVNINDVLADYNTQLSARNAAKVASNITQVNLANKDLIYNIKANASLIEGTSAGSVMAVATVASLENKNIKEEVFMTGAIDENGNILPVAGIKEKSEAAKRAGADLFLIPKGDYINGYGEEISCARLRDYEYCEISYTPEFIDVSSMFGLDVKEVSNVREAAELILDEK